MLADAGRRRILLALHAAVWTPRPPALASELDVVFALAPLLQARTALISVDTNLFAELLAAPARVDSAGGVATEEGATARKAVKSLLQQAKLRKQGEELASVGRRVGALDGLGVREVTGHAREAEERLAAILEFDASYAFKRDALGDRLTTMRPDELAFYHGTLVSARQEVD
jgi:hypothetical protein